jgi:hypothetical protein
MTDIRKTNEEKAVSIAYFRASHLSGSGENERCVHGMEWSGMDFRYNGQGRFAFCAELSRWHKEVI